MPSFLVLRLVQPLLVDFSCRLLSSLFSTPRDSLHPNSFSSSFSLARIPIFNAPLPLLLSQPFLTDLVSQEMPNLNELFKTVENYEGMTIEQLQVCFCCCARFHSWLGLLVSRFWLPPMMRFMFRHCGLFLPLFSPPRGRPVLSFPFPPFRSSRYFLCFPFLCLRGAMAISFALSSYTLRP